mgnify:CR=1 FL=1
MNAVLTPKDFATSQEVRWCPGCGDYAILKAVQKALADVGATPESTAFIAGMTAVRLTMLLAELNGLPPRVALERAHEALFYVGLGEARYRELEGYSQGMKQRLKLAQALVHDPRLLLLDEPTNGLDPAGRDEMLDLIKRIGASTCSFLPINF